MKENNNPEIQETFRFPHSPASKQPLLLQVNDDDSSVGLRWLWWFLTIMMTMTTLLVPHIQKNSFALSPSAWTMNIHMILCSCLLVLSLQNFIWLSGVWLGQVLKERSHGRGKTVCAFVRQIVLLQCKSRFKKLADRKLFGNFNCNCGWLSILVILTIEDSRMSIPGDSSTWASRPCRQGGEVGCYSGETVIRIRIMK